MTYKKKNWETYCEKMAFSEWIRVFSSKAQQGADQNHYFSWLSYQLETRQHQIIKHISAFWLDFVHCNSFYFQVRNDWNLEKSSTFWFFSWRFSLHEGDFKANFGFCNHFWCWKETWWNAALCKIVNIECTESINCETLILFFWRESWGWIPILRH